MIQREFTFQGQVLMAEGVGNKHDIKQIILKSIPHSVQVEKASLSDDMNGIDYWVTLASGRKISVDTKVRDRDWLKLCGKDDISLETWSKVGSKIGWTRNAKKQTDWIVFIWSDTGRYLCLPFPWLCSVFIEHWEQWREIYQRNTQCTKNPDGSQWKSECVFVPRNVLWKTVCNSFVGFHLDA